METLEQDCSKLNVIIRDFFFFFFNLFTGVKLSHILCSLIRKRVLVGYCIRGFLMNSSQ